MNAQRTYRKQWLRGWTLSIAAAVFLLSIAPAFAQTVPLQPADTCTDGSQFTTDVTGPGVFSSVAQTVSGLTTNLAQNLFGTIQGDPGFKAAVGAAVTLYIAIYAILFMTAQIRLTTHDFVIRIVKVLLMGILVGGSAWTVFNTYVATFFSTASDEFMGQIAFLQLTPSGPQLGGDAAAPMVMGMMDQAIAKVISANMGVHLLAMLFTPPYGFFYLVLLVIALWSFLSLLFTGIWVYLTAMVMRALLIGIAPIFLVCLLFARTKHLFIGWLNQLFNTCIQPILLFSFLSFFVQIEIGAPGVTGIVDQILGVPVCWTGASESLQGTPFNIHYWRFEIPKSGAPDPNTSLFEPYGGKWDWTGPVDAPGSSGVFPVQLLPLLTFLILAELGKRFGQMVLMIARDLSGSSIDLSGVSNIVGNLIPGSSSSPSAASAASTRQGIANEGIVGTLTKNIANMVGGRNRS
jgi:TrbL/VirB6 plasmid conjugal transfer protein